MEAIVGTEILGKDGNKATLEAKYVGLYFSAHWCPPCRQFTPELVTFYQHLKDTKPGQLEIIFISWDGDEDSYKEYYNSMPWLSLPFDSDLKEKLGEKYQVQGIPSLVLLDGATGEVVRKQARGMVDSDPSGDKFPWLRQSGSIEMVIGTDIVAKDGSNVTLSAKYVGLYFSAHWCPPCRFFTPELAKFYTDFTVRRPGELEIVFVSFDRDEKSYKEYFDEMPWYSLPFDTPLKRQLGEDFEVEGIPTLVILDRMTSAVVQAEGRAFVSSDATGADFPWEGKRVPEDEETGDADVKDD